jgi:S-formylglutathione hydrolase FrmB
LVGLAHRPRRAGPLAAALLIALAGLVAGGCGATGGAAQARVSPSRVSLGRFHSAALRGQDHFAIYLPPGYAGGRRRYPVVYYLHGLPAKPDSYRRSRIASMGRDLERHGLAAILVAPQGARRGDSDPEWHDWGPGRDWERATAVELVAYVQAHYRTLRDRRARAIVGTSGGGYGAP